MAGMGCYICRNILRDHDGSIVFDVYTKEELQDFNRKYLNQENPKLEDIVFHEDYELFNDYFWKCDRCQSVYLWDVEDSSNPNKCRVYSMTDISKISITLDQVKQLEEILIINLNDNTDDLYVSDLFLRNPFRPYKYYVSDDHNYVYIVNTDMDTIDRIYKYRED